MVYEYDQPEEDQIQLTRISLSSSLDMKHHSDDDLFIDNHHSEESRNDDHGSNTNDVVVANVDDCDPHPHTFPSLNFYIKTLFALNGSINVVPSLAFLSLLNDRIQMPLEYLPSFYAIEFLPYSLKPLYAILSYWISTDRAIQNRNIDEDNEEYFIHETSRIMKRDYRIQRHTLIVILQILASITMGFTAFLPPKAFISCYILGFLRSLAIAWAEFLNGLAMISSATTIASTQYHHRDNNDVTTLLSKQNYEEKILSSHQSQAANCRSIGSLMGQFVIFGIIVGRNYSIGSGIMDDRALSDVFITMNILGTALIPLTAAIVAYIGKVGSDDMINGNGNTKHSRIPMRGNDNYDDTNPMSPKTKDRRSSPKRTRSMYDSVAEDENTDGNHIVNNTTTTTTNRKRNIHITRVGLYLVLRHSIPSAGGIIYSFLYEVLRSKPMYLQLKSLIVSVTAVISTWFYGRYISKVFSNVRDISRFIVIMTVISVFLSLTFLPFYKNLHNSLTQLEAAKGDDGQEESDGSSNSNSSSSSIEVSSKMLLLLTLYQIVEGFVGELKFLPSVILGTNTIAHSGVSSSHTSDSNSDDKDHNIISVQDDDDDHDDDFGSNNNDKEALGSTIKRNCGSCLQRYFSDQGILYGTMITCIDFGDVLADYIAGPIVKAFGIKRENAWHNLDWFIVSCAILSTASLGFLRLLWYSSKPVDR